MVRGGKCGAGAREKGEFGEAFGYGFELEQGREDDVDVRLGTLRLVDVGDCGGGEDDDGDLLRDGRFAVVREEAGVPVVDARGFIGGIIFILCAIVIGGIRRVIFEIETGARCSCRWDGCRGSRGGQIVGYDGEGKERDVVFLRQADRGGGSGEGGAEGAMEGCEGDAKIDGVVCNGGLDRVDFEDGVLSKPVNGPWWSEAT